MDEMLKRLNEIVSILEKGNVTYEESVKLYEEAGEITKKCLKELSKQKGKVQIVKQDVENFVMEDFEI